MQHMYTYSYVYSFVKTLFYCDSVRGIVKGVFDENSGMIFSCSP